MATFLKKYKLIILYGCSLALLLVILRWLEWKVVIMDHYMEIYLGLIALLFTCLGIWIAAKLTRPKIKTVIQEKTVIVREEIPFKQNEKELAKLNISKRELEVLELMAGGLSNQEIAEKLFLSLSTIKTHSSSLFEKLDVKRRTQAIEKAKALRLIA
ncbi:response regulator transcription factor [Pollutibacter soli]|uniref:response regulator transcription factor n=1 Tax=Pollutibacter soli TaxID=3034157 RepID=UPI0030133780